ncbi:MAG: purine-nucleoside phosphorylase [Chloroflexi bacterium]|nr:purine-nucleoside phosphorylase [Chloroflexota bacterium]
MDVQLSRSEIREAADFIARRITLHPRVGLVLGSGLASLAARIVQPTTIPYPDIPHFAPCTVEGHVGELVLGSLQGCPVLIMRGRPHHYEGYSMAQVTFPVRVMWALGVKVLLVTNAAGGLNPSFRAGDLMLITDHIGLPNMVGLNPLRGPNDPEIGPRFPDMSQVYDPRLRELASEAAAALGIALRQGVYVMLSGPSFETPADLRFLRAIGADAVGMSTVPETTVAHHAGIRVLGISGISNVAQMEPGGAKVTHEEVLEAGKILVSKLEPLIEDILRRLQPEIG